MASGNPVRTAPIRPVPPTNSLHRHGTLTAGTVAYAVHRIYGVEQGNALT